MEWLLFFQIAGLMLWGGVIAIAVGTSVKGAK